MFIKFYAAIYISVEKVCAKKPPMQCLKYETWEVFLMRIFKNTKFLHFPIYNFKSTLS